MTINLLEAIQARWGTSALSRLGGKSSFLDSRAVPTGFPELDKALGVEGIPRGKIVELFGPISSGAFTLALRILAHAQERGAPVALIDPPQSLDAAYAAQLGADLERLVILTPKTAREAFDIAFTVISSNALSLLVMDLAAPRSSRNWSPLVMTEGIRKLAGLLSKSNTAFLILNPVVDGESLAGRALRHFAAIRMHITRTDWIRQGEDIVGCRAEIHVVKNKLAPPYRKAEIEVLYQPDRTSDEEAG